VGNVTDNATYITTHLDKGHSSSEGTGIISTSDGFNITYTERMWEQKTVAELKHTKGYKSLRQILIASLHSLIMLLVYIYIDTGPMARHLVLYGNGNNYEYLILNSKNQ
jgi:hypothetical protein